MTRKTIVGKIKGILREVAPDAVSVLYGSEARGDARRDSDFDILVILPDSTDSGSFARRKIEITGRLYDIELESGATISPLIVLKTVWERLRTPFTVNVINEGIVL